MPDAVGVPLMVIVFDAHTAVTPAGKPLAVPIPVAPVVAMVILVSPVLMHSVGVEDGVPAVLFGLTVTVTEPPVQPPAEQAGDVACV